MASTAIDTDVAGLSSGGSVALTDGTDLKIKLFTGTTGSSEGDNTEIALGAIDEDKVVSVTGLVSYGAGAGYATAGFSKTAGYNFSAYISGTNVRMGLHPTNSEQILSKSFKMIVTYYE